MKLKQVKEFLDTNHRMSHSLRRPVTVNFSADDVQKFIKAATTSDELTEWCRVWLAIQKDMKNDFVNNAQDK